MGKPKRDKKSRKDEEDLINGDDEVEESADPVDSQAPAKAAVGGKKGKKGRRKKGDDWEDDIASEIASLSLDAAAEDLTNGATEAAEPVKQKKKKKTRKLKEVEDVESGEDDEEVAEKMKMGFGMLGDMDDNDSAAEDEENDSEDEEKKQSSEDEEEIVKVEETKKVDKKKSKKSKQERKKAQTEEDDIDAILAQIESTSKPGKKGKGKKTAEPEAASQEPIVTPESAAKVLDDEDVSDDDHEMKEEDGEADEGEGGSTVKTAAQKKKEKRERQKQQKLQKGKSASQKAVKPEPTKEEKVDVGAAGEDKPIATPEAGEPAPSMADQKDEGNIEEGKKGDGGEEEDKKKKKDRRKKKKGEEEEKPTKKKPPSKMVKAMQEQLRKIQEEEERLKREEEEKIRIAEEAQREREEKEKVEKERKEREKQKKKEKMERLKAEGKLLTAKQKEAQKRAQQMLEAMKAQGLEIPQKVDGEKKKRVVYTKKKKTSQSQDQEPVSPSEKTPSLDRVSSVEESSEVEKAEEEEEPAPQEVEKVEEVTDSWEDVKDSWEDETEYRNKGEDAVDGADVTDSPVKVTSKDAERASEAAPTREAEAEEEGSSEEESETDSSDEESDEDETNARQRAEMKILQRHEEAEKKRTTDVLRAPVVVVLGHVDTGKTKLLDKLRRTNVQDGEAGGITQQIGATNVPFDAIREQTKMCKEFAKQELKIPGMLIIDTPGHESFSNLRSRGSSLCDIAILVVDIMHGLEPQTIESINLLKERKTPFIVALNKIDRLFQWQSCPHSDVLNAIKKQKPNTKLEFDERLTSVKVQFAEQGLNATLFSENKDILEYISLVPTSAHSGDGIGNLIALICMYSQKLLARRISYSEELQATAMEVKALPGLGTTVDVILVNGILHEGDTIILAGTEGPIVTQIRGLLMPKPMKEIRVKTNFDHHKEVQAAQGVKIIAKDLEKSLAGLPVYISYGAEETEIWKEEIASALKDVLASIRLQERGVYVQASTLGSLEALLEFLRTSKIPYCGINIGPVHKKDIMKASVMLEHDSQYAVILAFDVKVERDAQEMADGLGVKIFTADIIYHLFDKFMAFREKLKKQKQEEFKFVAVFPCKVRILPQYVFNSRDPIVVGVIIETGFVKVGTPLCVPSKEFLYIGRVTSLELNHKPLEKAVKGQEVCIKIEPTSGETPKMFGRHFDHTDMLVSRISRESIDAVKHYFREEMTKTDWQLMVELKKAFEII